MKKLLNSFLSASAGFTMIELLIVIAILGILAVAVLSAINPVEQINRGRDTASRGDAEQMINAIDRFNAFQGYYPWTTGLAAGANVPVAFDQVTEDYPADADGCTLMQKLGQGEGTCTGTDELKES
jgi:prepilin-type N-terminal cleavage/methylation domain-containing protein